MLVVCLVVVICVIGWVESDMGLMVVCIYGDLIFDVLMVGICVIFFGMVIDDYGFLVVRYELELNGKMLELGVKVVVKIVEVYVAAE